MIVEQRRGGGGAREFGQKIKVSGRVIKVCGSPENSSNPVPIPHSPG